MTTDEESKEILIEIRNMLKIMLGILIIAGGVSAAIGVYQFMDHAFAADPGAMAVNVVEVAGQRVDSPYAKAVPVRIVKP